MVPRVASVGLLRLLLTLRPAAALAAAAAWQGPSDALALVQRALLQQAVLQEPPAQQPPTESSQQLEQSSGRQEPPAQQPPKESSQQLEQSFPPGSEAEVAVAAGSGGVEFQRCTIEGHGAAPNSYDIYLLDVAPAYRSVKSVPWELLRSPGGAGRPASELQVLLDGGAPDDRREVVDKAVALLKRSAKAPADPAKAAELEAALRHEAAKTEALKARLELEQAEAGKRKRRSRTPAAKAAKPRRGKASASFDAFDRNGDGIVTREEFQASEPAKQAANSTPSMPLPSPMPALLRAKVDAGQSVKVWERRAKDWEGQCQEEERPRLLQLLEAMRREKAEVVLARLPANCSGQQLRGGGQGVAYEELTTCVQALTNTSWACSVCPVKFMISLGANCQRRCTSLAQGRGRSNDCLECARQPALRLLRCAGAPGVGEIERRLIGLRLSERTAELFRGGLAESMGGQQALNRLQRQAWAVQRLIVAWGLDPKGLDMLAAPLLKAMGVKTEAELDATPVPPAPPSDDSTSALITASDVALYDADGSGTLEGEELSRAIAGVVERRSGRAESKKGGQELSHAVPGVAGGKRGSEESAAEGVSNSSNTTAVPVVLSREERRRLDEERRLKLQEERKRQAEAHAKWKEERMKAEEEARQKAAEDAKRRVEEMAKKKADQLAERQAREEAARQAKEEEKRQAEEDARLEREEEEERRRNFEARQKDEEDARIKAIEDARRQAEEEERRAAEAEKQRIENDPRLKAQEAAWKDALTLEEEGQGETLADETAKRKAEEEAKSSAAEEAARQKAAEEARRTEEAAKQKAEEEAKSKAAEEAARQKVAEEARRTEEAAKQKAEEEAKSRAAQEAARQKVAEEARRTEEAAKQKAEEAAQQKAAEEAKMAAEEAAKQKAVEEAKRAKEAAKLKAEEEAKTRTEEAMKLKAEEKAVTRTKETAKQEAEEEAKRKADEPKQKAEEQVKVADDEARRMAEQEAKRKAESEVKQKAEVTSSQAVAATGTTSTNEAAQSTAGSAEEAGTDDLS